MNLLARRARIDLFHVDIIVIILITMGVHGLILDSFLVYCLLLVIVILATGAVLLLGALLLMVQWILGIQVDECATAIVRFHHWVWLVLARW